jgi:hypothetical protein
MCLALIPVAARAIVTSTVVGTVTHISATNIDVKDQSTGKTMKFVMVPRFKNIFAKDGKTPAQMSALTPGTPVTVVYDRSALGIPHADRIMVNGSVRSLKG